MRRARLCFLMLALSLASTPAVAETQLGLIGGLNFSNLRIEGANSLGVRTSFAAGGVVDVGLNDRFGIRIEPMFLSKGTKATQRNAYWGTVDGAVFKLDYINVPVLARIDLAASETRGYFVGGVSVGFATQLEVELSQTGTTETVDFGDVFSPNDVSLDLGFGVSLPVGTNRMSFDGRAAIGLTEINEGGTVTFRGAPLAVPPTSTKTVDFRLFASYLFPLSRK